MAKGQKTGGRVKGTPNRKTKKLMMLYEDQEFDPIIEMILIAKDYDNNSPELRGKMCSELAQYIHAKRKAIEHTADDDTVDAINQLMDLVNNGSRGLPTDS
ncbi:MAG: hypothetical protein ACPGJI_08120 [Kangiellaceae bacterium]